MIKVKHIETYLLKLQDRLSHALCQLDSKLQLQEDHWERPAGGGGCTRILKEGTHFEQAGVNFSNVHGEQLPTSVIKSRPELASHSFQGLGLSLVIHPLNPYIPTTHMNIRFFSATQEGETPTWWFGGGFDLTPYYPFKEDVRHWHNTAKKACDGFGKDSYKKYKSWCDQYFYLKHRKEARGVGGLFFDYLNEWGLIRCFEFAQSIGDHFLPAYLPIVARRKDMVWGERERDFQCYRRGRYVEFNLIHDRGTLFGLQSNGRIESILMSLPPKVHWRYDWRPEPDSAEAVLYRDYLPIQDWAD